MASTRGLISGTQLRQMQQHAVLINTARGGIVDEAALDSRASARRPPSRLHSMCSSKHPAIPSELLASSERRPQPAYRRPER